MTATSISQLIPWFRYGFNISNQDQVGPIGRIFITVFYFTAFQIIDFGFL